ncbi:MAG TPA: fluoride efflux transporter CrcB [Gammaproteobacteria bacterium]|nr:fluoride efflux transporter CrcB [Gammaproteobacteria bacterium]
MTYSLAVAAGGAVGALLRYWTSVGSHALLGTGFPYGTLVVNTLGSMGMGFLSVLLLDRVGIGPEWRAAVLVGLLGAFTTFSTFSMETFHLVENGARLRALGNVALNLVLCLAAVWLGVIAGRKL